MEYLNNVIDYYFCLLSSLRKKLERDAMGEFDQKYA